MPLPDNPENVDLAKRAEELAVEAEELRKRFSAPEETGHGRSRRDDEEIDKTLSDSLSTLRRIARR